MIRRILEAIDEVELDVAPAFQKKPGKMDALAAVRKAILDEIGPFIAANVGLYDYDPDTEKETWDEFKVADVIAKATYTGEDDPGQWAPQSYVVVHHESGIPDAFDGGSMFEAWVNIGDRASELSGIPMFNESINPGVSAMGPK